MAGRGAFSGEVWMEENSAPPLGHPQAGELGGSITWKERPA